MMTTFECQETYVVLPSDNNNRITYYHSEDKEFHATIVFTYEYLVDEWVRREGTRVFRHRTRHPNGPEINVNLDRHQFIDVKEVVEILKQKLRLWPVDEELLSDIINEVAERIRKAYGSITDSCNAVKMYFPMTIIHKHVYDETHDMEMAIQRSEEEEMTYMVPAAQWAIESLKRVELMDDSKDQCRICFEEMIKGEQEAAAVPCSHMFHRDCIKQWLNKSHYCPLCRFEMPIEYSN